MRGERKERRGEDKGGGRKAATEGGKEKEEGTGSRKPGISKVPRLTHGVCYRGLWQGRARVTFPVIFIFSLYHPDPPTVQASRDV